MVAYNFLWLLCSYPCVGERHLVAPDIHQRLPVTSTAVIVGRRTCSDAHASNLGGQCLGTADYTVQLLKLTGSRATDDKQVTGIAANTVVEKDTCTPISIAPLTRGGNTREWPTANHGTQTAQLLRHGRHTNILRQCPDYGRKAFTWYCR